MNFYLRIVAFLAFLAVRNVGGQTELNPCVPDPPDPEVGRCVCFPAEDNLKRPHPHDCALYFHCEQDPENPARYYQTIKPCTYGWGFDTVTFDCSETPICEPSASPPTTTPGPETSPPTTTELAPTGCPPTGEANIPDTSDCNSYFICQDGERTSAQCPPGWNFDYPSGQCLASFAECYPGSVTATGSPGTPPTPTEPTTTIPTAPGCPTLGEANIPDPTDCNKYRICINGTDTPAQCPSGWTFDWISRNCLAYSGTCFPGSSPVTGTPATLPPSDETTTEAGTTGSTDSTDTSSSTLSTSTEITSSSSSDAPETLPTSSTTSTSTTPTEAPEPLCPSDRNVVFPHPSDCSKYIECIFGEPNIRTCPSGSLFDFKLEECVPRLNAKCISGCGRLGHFTYTKLNLMFLFTLFVFY